VADNRQVILGLQLPDIVILFFDMDGNFLEAETIPLSLETQTLGDTGLTVEFQDAYNRELRALEQRLDYKPSTIRVKQFFLHDLELGIEDLPSHYVNVLQAPSQYEEEEVAFIRKDLERWKQEGWFVFHWGTDYWMDKDGHVVAS
jgi:hypothetical protein